MATRSSGEGAGEAKERRSTGGTEGGGPGGRSYEHRAPSKERRSGRERRARDEALAEGDDRRLAERRSGLERRRPHLHYEDLTPHPRPDRNINDYPLSTDEVEFINAINDYKDKFGRPFPTWSEVLHVLRTLGYLRVDTPFPPALPGHGPFGAPPEAGGGAKVGEAAGGAGPAEGRPKP